MNVDHKDALLGMTGDIKRLAFDYNQKHGPRSCKTLEEFTLLLTIERTFRNAQSLHPMIERGIKFNEQGIGLVSRTILTDFITVANALHLEPNKEDAFCQLHGYDRDLIRKHRNRMTDVLGDDAKDEIELLNLIQEERFSQRLDHFYTHNTLKKYPNLGNIVTEIGKKGKPYNQVQNEVISAYSQWFLLSKHEHMGYASYALTRDGDEDRIATGLRMVLAHAVTLLIYCLEALKAQPEQKVATELREAWVQYMNEVKPSTE